MDKPIERDVEVCVAVGPEGGLLAVDTHFGLPVDALELQHQMLHGLLRAKRKALGVEIIPPLKPAYIQAAQRLRRALFPEHRVVGQRYGDSISRVIQMLDKPTVVKVNGFH